MKLVIAEKPSVAKTYADVLGAKSKKDGYYEGNGYVISWCVGHLLGLAEPSAYDEKYAKWNKADLPISPNQWKYKATASTKKQLNILLSLIKRQDITSLVNGADAGREGELIFGLVYEHSKSKKPVERLWISSMEESAVKEGFANLKSGTDYTKLCEAAKCRGQADWLVGMNFSRLFSIIYNTNLRVGRVQTPTLAMVVDRHEKMNNFIKTPFYIIEMAGLDFIAIGEKLTDKTKAIVIANKCNQKIATITSIKQQDKHVSPPKLYDLTTLQREANKLFGYTASKTLELVQTLYEKKLVTYPRTDSKFITDHMAHGIPTLVFGMKKALTIDDTSEEPIVQTIVNNSKVTDHHAIIPTPTAANHSISQLPTDEQNILKMVAVKLIAATSLSYAFAETVVTVECEGETFDAKGKSVKRKGFKAIEEAFTASFSKMKKEKEAVELPSSLQEGQTYPVTTTIREGFTSPPKAYTEDTLLSAMETAGSEGVEEDIERKGLGTPATRASIIENLVKNEFLTRDKKNIVPTEKGINLIKVLPNDVKSPLLTADWENKLKRMERGQVSPASFMTEINQSISNVVTTYSEAPAKYKELFGSSSSSGEIVGTCLRCKKDVVEKAKVYSCIEECGFVLFKDNKLLSSQKSKLTKTMVQELLSKGSTFVKNLVSSKTGKKYSATLVLVDDGTGYPGLKMDFNNR